LPDLVKNSRTLFMAHSIVVLILLASAFSDYRLIYIKSSVGLH